MFKVYEVHSMLFYKLILIRRGNDYALHVILKTKYYNVTKILLFEG